MRENKIATIFPCTGLRACERFVYSHLLFQHHDRLSQLGSFFPSHQYLFKIVGGGMLILWHGTKKKKRERERERVP